VSKIIVLVTTQLQIYNENVVKLFQFCKSTFWYPVAIIESISSFCKMLDVSQAAFDAVHNDLLCICLEEVFLLNQEFPQ